MTQEAESHERLVCFLSGKANSYSRAIDRANERIAGLERKAADLESSRAGVSDAMFQIDKYVDLAAAAFHQLKMRKRRGGLVSSIFLKPKIDGAALRLLRSSALFDPKWYRHMYRDVSAAGIDPVIHYLKYGFAEGRWPCALFDSRFYLRNNLDVLEAGENPLVHYIKFGASELRQPNAVFDTAWYGQKYPQFKLECPDPLSHYMKFAMSGNFDPSEGFSSKEFREKHLHLDFSIHSPLAFALHDWDSLMRGT